MFSPVRPNQRPRAIVVVDDPGTLAQLRAALAHALPDLDSIVLTSVSSDALDTLAQRISQLSDNPSGSASSASYLRRIHASAGNTVKVIQLDEVCYFQSSDKYTLAVTPDGQALLRTSLKDLLTRLPPDQFRQIYRGTIVNLDHVAAAVRDDNGRVSLKLKRREETLAVSRVFVDLFKPM
jgi:DNA-binding LytR/AlgR family response regulator